SISLSVVPIVSAHLPAASLRPETTINECGIA
ncbi:MAG: hypothetical protein ACI9ON_004251, partial [Limisphaerales bacterium]